MILPAILLLGLVVAAIAILAAAESVRLGLGFRQALLYLPFRIGYRITTKGIPAARKTPAPVIYVVVHQSRIDPALMLSLLPPETLHILDPVSARAGCSRPAPEPRMPRDCRPHFSTAPPPQRAWAAPPRWVPRPLRPVASSTPPSCTGSPSTSPPRRTSN